MTCDECYWCGMNPKPAYKLVPHNRHEWTQSIVMILIAPCCGVPVGTEYYGTVLDYLCDGWQRAQNFCRLYNESVGAPVDPEIERPKRFVAPPRKLG